MTYTVQAGDSLSKIARDVLGDMTRWREIAQLNNLADPYTIYVGQALTLPSVTSVSSTASQLPATTAAAAPAWLERLRNPWVLGGVLLVVGGIWYALSDDD